MNEWRFYGELELNLDILYIYKYLNFSDIAKVTCNACDSSFMNYKPLRQTGFWFQSISSFFSGVGLIFVADVCLYIKHMW